MERKRMPVDEQHDVLVGRVFVAACRTTKGGKEKVEDIRLISCQSGERKKKKGKRGTADRPARLSYCLQVEEEEGGEKKEGDSVEAHGRPPIPSHPHLPPLLPVRPADFFMEKREWRASRTRAESVDHDGTFITRTSAGEQLPQSSLSSADEGKKREERVVDVTTNSWHSQ